MQAELAGRHRGSELAFRQAGSLVYFTAEARRNCKLYHKKCSCVRRWHRRRSPGALECAELYGKISLSNDTSTLNVLKAPDNILNWMDIL